MFSFLFASDAFLSANLSLQQCNSNNGTYLFMLFFFYIFLSFFSHLLFFPLPVFFLFSLFFSVFWHSFEKIGQSIISSARLFFFSFPFFFSFWHSSEKHRARPNFYLKDSNYLYHEFLKRFIKFRGYRKKLVVWKELIEKEEQTQSGIFSKLPIKALKSLKKLGSGVFIDNFPHGFCFKRVFFLKRVSDPFINKSFLSSFSWIYIFNSST